MAVHSMTGYGESRVVDGALELTVEVRSVNHRFLDVVWRLPSGYQRFEPDLARLARAAVSRGRLELSVMRAESGDPAYQLRFNQDLFEKYLAQMKNAFALAGIGESASLGQAVVSLLSKREVLELAPVEASLDAEYGLLERAVKEALARLVEMRTAEGTELEAEVRGHLQALEATIQEVQKRVQTAAVDFKARLTARLERISPGVEVEPERLAQEVAMLAERVDVTEEIARLQSHFLQFKKVMDDGEGGRKLEFLLQEFGREINTIGSKAQNSEVTALVVESKSLVEKMREQVANIE